MRKALYLLGNLEETDIDWMLRSGRKQFCRTGTILIHEGKEVDSLFLLIEGSLAVKLANGTTVATLLSGEIVGEVSFVDTRPPLASVVALQDAHVLAVDRAHLRGKLAADTGFAARFYFSIALFLADRLRSTTSRFGYGAVEENAADELDDAMMDSVSVANVRFDDLIKRLRSMPDSN